MYERGLTCLDKALDLPMELPGSTEESLKKVRKDRTKMLRTRQQVVFRLREISSAGATAAATTAHPITAERNATASGSTTSGACVTPSAPPFSEMPPS